MSTGILSFIEEPTEKEVKEKIERSNSKKTFPNIAKFVKKKRLIANLSQGELSLGLGFKNGQFISNLERSICGVPARKIKLLSLLLHSTPGQVINATLMDDKRHYKLRVSESVEEL